MVEKSIKAILERKLENQQREREASKIGTYIEKWDKKGERPISKRFKRLKI